MQGTFLPWVLPQFAGTAYGLSQQQLIAQRLAANALNGPQLPAEVGSGGSQNYKVMPQYSLGSGIAQLGQAALAGHMINNVAQGMGNLGSAEMQFLTGGNAQQPNQQGPGLLGVQAYPVSPQPNLPAQPLS